MKPFPAQIEGADFLSRKQFALLASEPRTGKTGAAIMASDIAMDGSVLVVTTASGCAVWKRAYALWSPARSVQVFRSGNEDQGRDVTIVGWDTMKIPANVVRLRGRRRARLILDESHYASKFSSRRTQAVYGSLTPDYIATRSLMAACDGVWALTGTPMPNSPADLYPMLRALCLERLSDLYGPTAVIDEEAFLNRYTVRFPMKTSRFAPPVMVVKSGRNEAELAKRLEGFFLRRTQADVGIGEPIHEILPLYVSDAIRRSIEKQVDKNAILAAADANDTKRLEMHMGPLRRLTGAIKAEAVAEAVIDEFNGGLDKIVLAYWHVETGDILAERLERYGVLRIDGATTAANRASHEEAFRTSAAHRVMLAQIQAAGEAVDFSAAAVLWFVEPCFTPAMMYQMSRRITNYHQTRQCFVRVAVLENSIDEAAQVILLRKWSSIREVLNPC